MALQAVESVVSLLILIGVGWWLAGRTWFGAAGASLFSKYTVNVAVPCFMFYNMVDVCGSREKLASLLSGLPFPVLIVCSSFAFGMLLAHLLKVAPQRKGVFLNVITFSNVVFVGLPVVSALFGDDGLPYAMIYYLANTLFFWSGGVWLLRRYSDGFSGSSPVQMIRGIFSPPIVGMLLGVAAVLLGLRLPDFLYRPVIMLKNTATPIAMLFIGSVIRSTGMEAVEHVRELAAVLLVRFVLTPLLVAALAAAFHMELMMQEVFVLLSAMPAMTQLGVMAKESGSDYGFAALLITLTTAVSMIVIPLYMALMEQFLL